MNIKKYKRIIYILAFIIPVIAVLIGFILGGYMPFNNKDVITAADSSHNLQYYYELYDRVHEGKSIVYTDTTGLGDDFTSIVSYRLSDPTNYLILLFPRNMILTVLNILYMLKVGLAGLFMCIFLVNRRQKVTEDKEAMEKKRSAIINRLAEKVSQKVNKKDGKKDFKLGGTEAPRSAFGTFISNLDLISLSLSIAYALSNYMLGPGLLVDQLLAVAVLPLIILGLEKLIFENKWKLYVISFTISVFGSIYISIISFIFVLFYFLLSDFKDVSHFFRSLIRKFISDVIILGLSSAIIINAVSGLSFKSEIKKYFPDVFMSTTFWDTFKMTLTGTAPSNILYYGHNIYIACGLISIFMLFLYAFNGNIKIQKRLKSLSLAVILFIAVFISTPNFLFNGLKYTSSLSCNFAFILIFMLITIAHENIINIEHIRIPFIHLTGAVLAAMIILSLLLSEAYDSANPFITSLEVLFVYYILTLIYRSNSMTKLLYTSLVAVICIFEIVIPYTKNISYLGKITFPYEYLETSERYELIKNIHSNSDINNPRILLYNSSDSDSSPFTNTILGYDYIVARTKEPNIDRTLEKVDSLSSKTFTVYKNPYSAHAFFVKGNIYDYEYNEDYPFDATNTFTRDYVGSEDMFTLIGSDILNAPDRNEMLFSVTPYESGDLYSKLFYLYHHGQITKNSNYEVSQSFANYEKLGYRFFTARFNKDNYIDFYNKLNTYDITLNSDGYYSDKVNVPDDGYLIIGTNNTNSLKVNVNGKEIKPYSPINGAIALPVNKGDNSITISYSPKYFFIGLCISILTAIILALLAIRKIAFGFDKVDNRNRLVRFVNNNYVYLTTILIATGMFIICLMFKRSEPFGTAFPIGGDGFIQAYAQYKNEMINIKNNQPLNMIDYSLGMTLDNYSSRSFGVLYMILRPWKLLLYRFLPESLYVLDYSFTFYFYFVMTGIVFIYYLTHRRTGKTIDKKNPVLIVFGLAYTLSAYSIGFFLYQNFTLMVMVPLIYLGLEKLVYDKKPALYLLSLFWLMANDAYYAFICCIFIVLYYLIMNHDSVKAFFLNGIRVGIWSVCSACLSAAFLIPYYIKTTYSPYVAYDNVAPSITKWYGNFIYALSEYHAAKQGLITSPAEYRSNIYCGLLVVLLVPLYVSLKNIKLGERIRKMLFLVLLLVACDNEMLNYIFHGFHYQSQVPNRFTCFFIFMILVMFYDVLINFESIGKKHIVISMISMTAALSIIYYISSFNDYLPDSTLGNYLFSYVFLGIYLIFTIIYLAKSNKEMFRKAILITLCIELTVGSFRSFSTSVGNTDSPIYNNYLSNMDTFLKKHDDMKEPFVLTERLDDSFYQNISAFNESHSLSCFSSSQYDKYFDLLFRWGILFSQNTTYYTTGSPLPDMMLHVKYLTTDIYSASSYSIYDQIDQSNNLCLHENPYYLPLGVYFEDTAELNAWNEMSSSSANYISDFDRDNAFAHANGCNDIYTKLDIHDINSEEGKNGNYYIKEEKNSAGETPYTIYVEEDVSGNIYMPVAHGLIYIGTATKGEKDEFYINIPNFQTHDSVIDVEIGVWNPEEFTKLHEKLSRQVMTDQKYESNKISGKIDFDKDGILYLAMPNLPGWKAYVDGKEVELKTYMDGLAIDVTSGKHDIVLKYTPEGMYPGIIITFVTLLLLIVYFTVITSRKRKNS